MKTYRILSLALAFFAAVLASGSCACAQTNLASVTNVSGAWSAIALSGAYLYGGSSDSGLRVIDISEPTNPIDVGFKDTGSSCGSISVWSNNAYVFRSGGALDIFDISSRTNPVIISQISDAYGTPSISGHLLFLSRGSAQSIYDISNPTNPAPVGSLPPSNDIAVSGNYAYLAGRWPSPLSDGVLVCDVSDPANVIEVGFVPTYATTPIRIATTGNYACALSESHGGRTNWIFDISTRTNPLPVKTISGYSLGCAALSGDFAYWIGSSLDVYDVSDPSGFYPVATSNFPLNSRGSAILISKNYAYVAVGGLAIYSLGSPPPPPLNINSTGTNTLVLSWPTPTPAFAVQQSPVLPAGNWVTLTNFPVVVASRNEVTIPAPTGAMFYRLVSQ